MISGLQFRLLLVPDIDLVGAPEAAFFDGPAGGFVAAVATEAERFFTGSGNDF